MLNVRWTRDLNTSAMSKGHEDECMLAPKGRRYGKYYFDESGGEFAGDFGFQGRRERQVRVSDDDREAGSPERGDASCDTTRDI